ncbi:hypothetical protein A2U01_0091605, partial [Trifolium medium]|nr:hypothetical protein [Trifolium medium]
MLENVPTGEDGGTRLVEHSFGVEEGFVASVGMGCESVGPTQLEITDGMVLGDVGGAK